MDSFVNLTATTFLSRLNVTDLFVLPNILMRDRPEVYTFKKNGKIFILESGSGGILGHAHALKEVFPEKSKKIKNAVFYFTLENEYLHSHPHDTYVYYVGKNDNNEFAIFDTDSETEVKNSQFGAGHYHSLSIREVIDTKEKRDRDRKDKDRKDKDRYRKDRKCLKH